MSSRSSAQREVGSQPSPRLLAENCYIDRATALAPLRDAAEASITAIDKQRPEIVLLVGTPGSGKSVLLVQLDAELRTLGVDGRYCSNWYIFDDLITSSEPVADQVYVVDDLFRGAPIRQIANALAATLRATIITSCLPDQHERIVEDLGGTVQFTRVDMPDLGVPEAAALGALLDISLVEDVDRPENILQLCLRLAGPNIENISASLHRGMPDSADAILAMAMLDLDCPLVLIDRADEAKIGGSNLLEIDRSSAARVLMVKYRQQAGAMLRLHYDGNELQALILSLLQRLCSGDRPHPMATKLAERIIEQHADLAYSDAAAALQQLRSDPRIGRYRAVWQNGWRLDLLNNGNTSTIVDLVADRSLDLDFRSSTAAGWLLRHPTDKVVWEALSQLVRNETDADSQLGTALAVLLEKTTTKYVARSLAREWLATTRGPTPNKAWIISNILSADPTAFREHAIGDDAFSYLSNYLSGLNWTSLTGELLSQILNRALPSNVLQIVTEWLTANPDAPSRANVLAYGARHADLADKPTKERLLSQAKLELRRGAEGSQAWQSTAATVLRLSDEEVERHSIIAGLEQLVGRIDILTLFNAAIDYGKDPTTVDLATRHVLAISDVSPIKAAPLIDKLWADAPDPLVFGRVIEALDHLDTAGAERSSAKESLRDICQHHAHHPLLWPIAMRLAGDRLLNAVRRGSLIRVLLAHASRCADPGHDHRCDLTTLLDLANDIIAQGGVAAVEPIVGKILCARDSDMVAWTDIARDVPALFAGKPIVRSGRALSTWLNAGISDEAVATLLSASTSPQGGTRTEARYAAARSIDAVLRAIQSYPSSAHILAHLLARSIQQPHNDLPLARQTFAARREEWPPQYEQLFERALAVRETSARIGGPLYLALLSGDYRGASDRFAFGGHRKNIAKLASRIQQITGSASVQSIVIRDPYALQASNDFGRPNRHRQSNMITFIDGMFSSHAMKSANVTVQHCHRGKKDHLYRSVVNNLQAELKRRTVSFTTEEKPENSFHERFTAVNLSDGRMIMLDMDNGIDAFSREDAKSSITVHVITSVQNLAAGLAT